MLLSWRKLLVLKSLFLVIKLLVLIVLQNWSLFFFTLERTLFMLKQIFQFWIILIFAFNPYFILLFILQTYISLHVWCSIPISSKAEDSCAGKSKLREIHFSISFNLMNEIVQVISRIQRVVTIACTKPVLPQDFHMTFLMWTSCESSFYMKFMSKLSS